MKVKVKLLGRVRLSDPLDCSLPGSSIHGIFQARGLEWVAISFSNILTIIQPNNYTTNYITDYHMQPQNHEVLPIEERKPGRK